MSTNQLHQKILRKLYQSLIIPVRSKRTLLFLYTCFQIYHSLFIILFSNISPTESWNIFTNNKLDRYIDSYRFPFLLIFSYFSFILFPISFISFKISTALDRFIRLVLFCVVRSGNRSNKCRIKITKTSKNSLYSKELVSNWILFISIVFVCGCSSDRFNMITGRKKPILTSQ